MIPHGLEGEKKKEDRERTNPLLSYRIVQEEPLETIKIPSKKFNYIYM